ncbi:PIG-L deacetylase family protein [Streptomyces antibioticus]|uniref:PIG-L deacetylase family protein n=1 Tax=Streptomyces antibioticus TaxID=1890 RepID=UPI003406E328
MRRVPAVVVHPDDGSSGPGGLLALVTERAVPTGVLCLTHGEASTPHGRPGDPHALRADELACAAKEPGVERVEPTGHPNGGLDGTKVPEKSHRCRRTPP